MKNKILIGSIIAVVILVLVSFTGVVGYQTTKSATISRASPLFSVRSKRAIDEVSKDITCDYVGKGEAVSFPLPTLNSRNKLIQNGLEIFRGLDEDSFNRFVEVFRNRLHNDKEVENIGNLINSLKQLNDTSNELISDILDDYRLENYTIFNRPCSIGVGLVWIPGCIVIPLFLLLLIIIGYIFPPIPSVVYTLF